MPARGTGFSNTLFPSPWHPEHGRTRCPIRLNPTLDGGGDPLGVDSPAEKCLPGCRLRVTPCRLAASIGPATTRTQPTPAALRSGPPEKWWIRIVKPACSAWPRTGARGGARACRPKCVRIFSITGASRIAAMIFSSPPQFGQCSRSSSNTPLSSLAQLSRSLSLGIAPCIVSTFWPARGPKAMR